jgi:hypothetical protein
VIASRYHLTIEQFGKLTFKQINSLTKAIKASIIEERKYEASLHDKKIKDGPNLIDEDEAYVSEEAEKVLDDLANEDFKKWQKKTL